MRAFDPSAAPHGEVAATLPERLQQERKRLQFTAVQLADKAGVDRVALTKFESGELVPDATALQKLHAAGVDVAHVLLSLRAGSHAGADADDGTRALLQHYQQAGEEARAALRTLAALLARSS
ncbi:MAG: helix-turn-helix domain-containing protein [Burkholderiaceae bacterium]|nr:helix-turn-helix domain-containing protein [Burkholderiaceae bacterium]